MIEICAVAIVLACIIAIVYLLTRSKPVKFEKRTERGNSCLTITANQDLDRIAVSAMFDNEEINFERKKIKKGQTVEFAYPYSPHPAKLIVEPESGKTLVFEV